MKSYLSCVRKPARYLGNERNTVKDAQGSDLRVGLAFPDLYEIGMSNVGMAILYHVLNTCPGIFAERVFAPDIDLELFLRSKGLPLTTLETNTPLSALHILGFSLHYELTFTNVLTILELGGIPIHCAERTNDCPLVLAGGPCAFNPEPLSDFIDAFVIGEAEFRLPEICRLYQSWKATGSPRQVLLRLLADMEGVYVPAFFDFDQTGPPGAHRLVPLVPDKAPVRRCIVACLDEAPFPTSPIVPYLKVVHDRLNVEVARGCNRGCRFCQASVIYHPARERSPQKVYEMVINGLAHTGYEEVSLLSLSIGDYSHLPSLVHDIMNYLSPRRIGLSLPSLRVGSIDLSVFEEILRVRKTGFTFAPEAASPRLQAVINKRIDEDEIIAATRSLCKAGWTRVKLYYMIGLPTETDHDVEEIVAMARRIQRAAGRGNRAFTITVNVSTFVPKPHTPFQWEPQIMRSEAERKQAFLRLNLHPRHQLRFKWHDARLSLLEGVFARGDRRLGRLLERAYLNGCRLDGWSEHLRFDLWEQAFEQTGIDPNDYLRGRSSMDDPLPWDWIDTGIRKGFLYEDYLNATNSQERSVQCGSSCTECAACAPWKLAVCRKYLPPSTSPRSPAVVSSAKAHTNPYRIRLRYSKEHPAVYLSHLETITAIQRALRRTNLPLAYTQGLHPHPRISFGQALGVGIESLCEYMDVYFEEHIDPRRAMELLNAQLPQGLHIGDAYSVGLHDPSLEEATVSVRYHVIFQTEDEHHELRATVARCVNAFLSGQTSILHIRGPDRDTFTDLRHYVTEIRVRDERFLHIAIVISRSGDSSCSITKVLEALWAHESVPEGSYVIKKVDAWLCHAGTRPKPPRPKELHTYGK